MIKNFFFIIGDFKSGKSFFPILERKGMRTFIKETLINANEGLTDYKQFIFNSIQIKCNKIATKLINRCIL
jgi:hypothetical protein